MNLYNIDIHSRKARILMNKHIIKPQTQQETFLDSEKTFFYIFLFLLKVESSG